MTDKERLQKAIEKAKKNNPRLIYNIHLLSDKGWEEITKYYQIYIFNHDFAKAFWKVDANKINGILAMRMQITMVMFMVKI